MSGSPVLASGDWKTNAELIVDVAELGYLRNEWRTWDATYGVGAFWTLWKPTTLIGTDLDPAKGGGVSTDFTKSGWASRSFDCVVFDPPYRLNGTPDRRYDEDFGITQPASWRERLQLMREGVIECARVLGDGFLLVKCQDQVNGGKKRWQTDYVTEWAASCDLGKVDRLDMLSYRPQPAGRSQKHARTNYSTLLVFKRDWDTSGYCRLCQFFKPLKEFSPSGIERRECRPCGQERKRAWTQGAGREKHLAIKKRHQLKKLYNLTPEQFETMLKAQGGRCAICEADEPGGRGTWHVDHDHESGLVRALLCWQCNRRLGMLENMGLWRELAEAYLRRHRP